MKIIIPKYKLFIVVELTFIASAQRHETSTENLQITMSDCSTSASLLASFFVGTAKEKSPDWDDREETAETAQLIGNYRITRNVKRFLSLWAQRNNSRCVQCTNFSPIYSEAWFKIEMWSIYVLLAFFSICRERQSPELSHKLPILKPRSFQTQQFVSLILFVE